MTDPASNFLISETDSLSELSDLRTQYLDSLVAAQELYLELMVTKARPFLIKINGERAGYFLLDEAKCLLEYYLTARFVERGEEVIGAILKQFSVKKALCLTFNHFLLNCCLAYQKRLKTIGISFRERIDIHASSMPFELTVRAASMKDEQHIIKINEEVFDHDHEVAEYIDKGQLLIFEHNGEVAGFGIFARVIEGRDDFDIGMLVAKQYRRRGLGETIIRYLADYCGQRGWRPVCGCAVDNIGSRRSIEKAGFIAGYRLLEFIF